MQYGILMFTTDGVGVKDFLKASIEVELFDKKKKIVLLKDIGKSAGIEVAGKYELLKK